MPQKTDEATRLEFQSYYLQRATQELAEDLDRVRGADDFKTDSVFYLVHALQQGASQFSKSDQSRVLSARKEQKQ